MLIFSYNIRQTRKKDRVDKITIMGYLFSFYNSSN